MDDLFQLFFPLFIFLVVVLSIISKTDQGREFWNRFFKKYWYLPVLLPILPLAINFFIKGPNYGFDPDYVFDCQRATKKCEYHQSMLFDKNKKLHPVKTYDISKATSAKVKKFSSPLQYSDYYEIVFVSVDGEFYMPGWFPSFEEAEEEAAKINAFLKEKTVFYRYEHFTPQTSFTFSDIVIFIAGIGIVLYGVLLYKKRKKKKQVQVSFSDSPRYYKNPYLCFAAALSFAYSLFFRDMYSTFDCQSDTQKCEYYSSTLINRKLKLAQTYDISEITRTEVQRTNRKRRFYDNYPYRIRFVSHNKSFSMPQEFSSFDDAANEAVKIDAVLTKKKASYHYEASRPKIETVFHIIITPLLFLYGLILFGRKKEREEGKKQRPDFPALLRRKPHSSRMLPVKKDDTDV